MDLTAPGGQSAFRYRTGFAVRTATRGKLSAFDGSGNAEITVARQKALVTLG
ncbi:hypothetical protein [Shinella sp.]|jgi:hypothetical protein|uniref:hypothetical protein n=1 Tax=Shinella sp. TaxID=1870904 RepID=UPI002E159780